MTAVRTLPRPPWQRVGCELDDGAGLSLTIAFADVDTLHTVDSAWPLAREHEGIRHWRWCRVFDKHREGFVLRARDGSVAGLWAGKYDHCVELEGNHWYRLDYLEAHPGTRGLGTFLLAAVALRAGDLGARGIVFAALPELVPWYTDRFSATRQTPKGWHVDAKLVPLCLTGSAFARLRSYGLALLRP